MTNAESRAKYLGRLVVFYPRSPWYAESPYSYAELRPGEAVEVQRAYHNRVSYQSYTREWNELLIEDIKLPEEI